MNVFHLTVSTPDGNAFCGDCLKLDVRGTEGDLAVMAGHIPFVTTLVPCKCVLLLEDGTEKRGSLSGGVLSVGKEATTLIAGSFAFEKEDEGQ